MNYDFYDSKIRDKEAMLDIKGAIIIKIEGLEKDSSQIVISTDKGVYIMSHDQDCCESVDVDDIIGELKEGATIYGFNCTTNIDAPSKHESDESYTWTFYTIATSKGYCDIKWYGSSNGYYSERVDFFKVDEQ